MESEAADWWRDSVKYMKALYDQAQFSALCNTAVSLQRMKAGQWVILGTGRDGGEGRAPRTGCEGLDLDRGYRGGPWPEENLKTVYCRYVKGGKISGGKIQKTMKK